jgi:tetratricopeptide (TPR) repeat protein
LFSFGRGFIDSFFRYNEAEQELNICLQIYKLCLPPNSFHYLVTKASLGLLYKQQGDYRQALGLFENIFKSIGKLIILSKRIIILCLFLRYKNSIISLDKSCS